MNILIHTSVGIIGSVVFNDFTFLVSSLLPDLVLLPNEILLLKTKQRFDEKKIPLHTLYLYRISHSLFFSFLCLYLFGFIFFFGLLIHQILDWISHRNSFRTMPFFPVIYKNIHELLINKKQKKCITISGGFDSGCLPFLITNVQEYDFVFFDYNQLYLKNELQKAKELASKFNKKLLVIKISEMFHDHPRRNFIFIAELKKNLYSEVVMGNRNLFPFFDKYKDSNWVSLQMVSILFNISIKLPLLGWNKKRILSFLRKRQYLNFYNCYNNLNDVQKCDCYNCKQLRKINK